MVALRSKSSLALMLFLALPLSAGPPNAQPNSKEKTAAEDSPLVRAAKATRATAGAKKSRVVLNNDDVKNSKGKLIYITESPVAKPSPPKQSAAAGPAAAVLEAGERVEAAREEVAELERALAEIEQDFYDETDINYRQGVIKNRFEQTRKQLEIARQKLADAREERQRVEAQAVNP